MANKNHLQQITEQDTNWDSFVQDQLEDEDRDVRNALVAAKVLRYLKQQGKTKTWLAGKMNLSPQRLGEILKGRGNMTFESVKNLETATGLTLMIIPEESVPAVKVRKTSWEGIVKAVPNFFSANVLSGKEQDLCPAQ